MKALFRVIAGGVCVVTRTRTGESEAPRYPTRTPARLSAPDRPTYS